MLNMDFGFTSIQTLTFMLKGIFLIYGHYIFLLLVIMFYLKIVSTVKTLSKNHFNFLNLLVVSYISIVVAYIFMKRAYLIESMIGILFLTLALLSYMIYVYFESKK